MRKKTHVVVLALVVLLGIAAFATIPVLRTSALGHVIRWCLGEPGATQGVNDAADKILAAGWDEELVALADQLTQQYASIASTLPQTLNPNERLLPQSRLPQKFHCLGGIWPTPEFLLRVDAAGHPTAILLHWANGRHQVIVYAQAPATPPRGFVVRQVNDRIYVLANES